MPPDNPANRDEERNKFVYLIRHASTPRVMPMSYTWER
jgi:hypothetical protein